MSFNNILKFMFLFFNSIHMSATPALIHGSSSHIIERKIFGLNFFFYFYLIVWVIFISLHFLSNQGKLVSHSIIIAETYTYHRLWILEPFSHNWRFKSSFSQATKLVGEMHQCGLSTCKAINILIKSSISSGKIGQKSIIF